jgi:hypothetical protein
MEASSERVRAWALFSTKDPAAAQKISDLFTQGGEDYVVIRADVVRDDQGTYNLVVPVDVKDETELKKLLPKLTAVAGPARLLRVVDHHPDVPHRAHSFVTPVEHAKFRLPEYEPPGRHPKSPGANPWG